MRANSHARFLGEGAAVTSSPLPGGNNYNSGFAYDRGGNPTLFKTSSSTYDLDDRFGIAGFSYDGNGNPTTYVNTSGLTYDTEDRLTGIPGMMSATYDGDGLRAHKSGSHSIYYLYDGEQPVVEMGALSNGGSIWNGYGADGLRARSGVDGSPTSGPVFYSYDPQGNLAHRFDPHGMDAASDLAAFDAYGALLGEYNVSGGAVESHRDPVGFGGQWGGYTDSETGLVLMTHRYYDAGKGRFLNRDPIGYDGGLNLYGYAGNNPVTGSDPSGTDAYAFIFRGNSYNHGVEEALYGTFGTHAMIAVDTPKGPLAVSYAGSLELRMLSKDAMHPGPIDLYRSSTFYGSATDVCHGYRIRQSPAQDAAVLKYVLSIARFGKKSVSEQSLFRHLLRLPGGKAGWVLDVPGHTFTDLWDNCTTEAVDYLDSGGVVGLTRGGPYWPTWLEHDLDNYMSGSDSQVVITRMVMMHD